MIGIVTAQYRKYAIDSFGGKVWERIASEARRNYTGKESGIYQEREDILSLVQASNKITGLRTAMILEGFGFYLVPNLLQAFSVYVKPEWKTLDFIEGSESTFYNFFKLNQFRTNNIRPKVNRVHRNKIVIDNYSSRMLSLSIGFIKGLASYYQETDKISMSVCTVGENSIIQVTTR